LPERLGFISDLASYMYETEYFSRCKNFISYMQLRGDYRFGSCNKQSELLQHNLNSCAIYPRRRRGFCLRLSVCLSVFPHDISKPMQLGSPNLTQKCYIMSPGNPFTLGSKGQSHEAQKHCGARRGSLHSCECWLLLAH